MIESRAAPTCVTARIAAAGLLSAVVLTAQADVRYDITVSAGQWYTGVGNAHSSSQGWVPDFAVPQETEQYSIKSRGASLDAVVSVTGEMKVGPLLTIGQAQASASPQLIQRTTVQNRPLQVSGGEYPEPERIRDGVSHQHARCSVLA